MLRLGAANKGRCRTRNRGLVDDCERAILGASPRVPISRRSQKALSNVSISPVIDPDHGPDRPFELDRKKTKTAKEVRVRKVVYESGAGYARRPVRRHSLTTPPPQLVRIPSSTNAKPVHGSPCSTCEDAAAMSGVEPLDAAGATSRPSPKTSPRETAGGSAFAFASGSPRKAARFDPFDPFDSSLSVGNISDDASPDEGTTGAGGRVDASRGG